MQPQNEGEVPDMLRLGAKPDIMREMELDDIFISRLQLLIIMSKAYLLEYPLGQHRVKSIVENAEYVKTDAVGLAEDFDFYDSPEDAISALDFDKIFYQRVKLLAVIAEAFAKGHALEPLKKEALEKNLHSICDAITFNQQISDIQFLKVA
jgi:hypothetical protein